MHSQGGDTFADHPAWNAALVEALRMTPEGEGIAESLECILDNACPFHLEPSPADEWDYVHKIYDHLSESYESADSAFSDRQHAFVAGVEIGCALTRHDRGWGSRPA
jgi:hypothetical protein